MFWNLGLGRSGEHESKCFSVFPEVAGISLKTFFCIYSSSFSISCNLFERKRISSSFASMMLLSKVFSVSARSVLLCFGGLLSSSTLSFCGLFMLSSLSEMGSVLNTITSWSYSICFSSSWMRIVCEMTFDSSTFLSSFSNLMISSWSIFSYSAR